MAHFRAASLCLSLLALAVWGCNPQQSPVASPPDTGVVEVIQASSVRAAGTPVGSFRTTPAADDNQVIRVFLGDLVTINGARFTPSNPDDELKLEVEWGDGQRSVNGCGPCRVEHVYPAGRYELVATVHDRRFVDRGSVTQQFTVFVSGPAEPISTPASTTNCHSIAAATGACPTGATQFCLAPGTTVTANNPAHAQSACNTCFGAGVCAQVTLTCFPPGGSVQTWRNTAGGTYFVYNVLSGTGWAPGDILTGAAAPCPAIARWAP